MKGIQRKTAVGCEETVERKSRATNGTWSSVERFGFWFFSPMDGSLLWSVLERVIWVHPLERIGFTLLPIRDYLPTAVPLPPHHGDNRLRSALDLLKQRTY